MELVASSESEARRLQAEVSGFYARAVLPLIERCCSEAGDPASLHRIDSLEIDLGQLDSHDLEADFIARLRAALPAALAAEIRPRAREGRESAPDSVAAARLEIFAFFGRTGRLPWWADAGEQRLLAETVRLLVERAPGPLARLLEELAREPDVLRRIALSLEDEVLEALVRAVAPSLVLGTDLHPSSMVTAARRAGSKVGDRRVRTAAWSALLQTAATWAKAGAGLAAVDQRAELWREALARLALSIGTSYRALVHALALTAESASSHESAAAQILDRLRRELPQSARGRPLVVAPSAAEPSGSDAVVTSGASDPLTEADAALGAWQRDRRAAASDRPGFERNSEHRGQASKDNRITEDGKIVGQRPDEPAADPGRDPTRFSERFADAFSETETAYVENAGLVILWPFLERFFERLDLLRERRFRDPSAAQRAVGLLQYVVAGDPSPPEYLVPLNKVLCGVAIAEPFDFGAPVSVEQAEECDGLLRATIAQAPILRDMSIPAFRGNFLLRSGALSARDGAWLLRVERQTHDLVLDRFPWGLEWVRLPWMPVPMGVEW